MPKANCSEQLERLVPGDRIRILNSASLNPNAGYVLYWMNATRRANWNFGLDRAIELALELGKPLIVFEPLRVGYQWASERFHKFVIDGMRDNAADFAGKRVLYYPFVEAQAGAGSGLLERLASNAAAVVTDDSPTFFLPRMLAATARRLKVRLEAVDSNGLLPVRVPEKRFGRAYDFRRFLQRELGPFLFTAPHREPRLDLLEAPLPLPDELLKCWPPADLEALQSGGLDQLPIDHTIKPGPLVGGSKPAQALLHGFITERLATYGEGRNQPEADGSSGLSPYLHFGHISTHEVLHTLAAHEGWSPMDMSEIRSGKRTGWWNLSAPAETFLDQIVTWRELGFNAAICFEDPQELDRISNLPGWAQESLEDHADDARPHIYSLAQFESAETHDELWNAAQNQLRIEGRMHNYLRMLWGKKILHWSASPTEALAIMVELNNKYALDGRDPNSSTGMLWVLGCYDRAWGPERPVFGKIRYMSSDNTRRKLRVRGYVERWNNGPELF